MILVRLWLAVAVAVAVAGVAVAGVVNDFPEVMEAEVVAIKPLVEVTPS